MKTIKKIISCAYSWILWVRDVVLFGQWQKFWDFIKTVHSQSDEASSKRFYGGMIIMSCLVLLFLFSAEVFSLKAWAVIAPYWTFLIVFGVALISLSVVEKIAGLIANFKVTSIMGAKQPDKPDQEATR